MSTTTKSYGDMTIAELASVTIRDWGSSVNYAAAPYLDAMLSLETLSDQYGADSGGSVVSYFVSNASTWRGEVAREVKAELRRRLDNHYDGR